MGCNLTDVVITSRAPDIIDKVGEGACKPVSPGKAAVFLNGGEGSGLQLARKAVQ